MPALLIVDDSITVRKMIMAALRPLKVEFGEAGSGLEAIEQLALSHYDAVTLDLNMPDMHGLEFLQFIRTHSTLKHIPILVLTTRSDSKMRADILAAGANDYLTKPFAPNELLQAMQALLSGEKKVS
jgi:two-component system, chemotaxis family, chemotaxis protein CheY